MKTEKSKTVQGNLSFILNVLSESSIHFTKPSIVLAKNNVVYRKWDCVVMCNYAGTCKGIWIYNLVYNFLIYSWKQGKGFLQAYLKNNK